MDNDRNAQPPDAKPVAWIIEHDTPSNRPDEPPEHYRGVTLVDPESHEGAYYGDEKIIPLYAAPQAPAGKGEGRFVRAVREIYELLAINTVESIDAAYRRAKEETEAAPSDDAIPREIHERLLAEKDEEINRLKESVRDRAACEALQYERAEEAERMLAREIDVASLLQTRAEAAERALAGAKAQALREAAEWFRQRHNKSDPTPWRDAMSYPESLLERMAYEHERGGK
jgi:hypothetical protein